MKNHWPWLVTLPLGLTAWAMLASRPRVLRAPTPAQIHKALPGQARAVFDKSDAMQILSLNPSWLNKGKKGSDMFHDFQALGVAQLTPSEQQLLRRHFYDGLADTQFSAACFNPRHGIRARKGSHTLELSICFACQHFETYLNGKKIGWAHIGKEPQEAFNTLLAKHKLPISR